MKNYGSIHFIFVNFCFIVNKFLHSKKNIICRLTFSGSVPFRFGYAMNKNDDFGIRQHALPD